VAGEPHRAEQPQHETQRQHRTRRVDPPLVPGQDPRDPGIERRRRGAGDGGRRDAEAEVPERRQPRRELPHGDGLVLLVHRVAGLERVQHVAGDHAEIRPGLALDGPNGEVLQDPVVVRARPRREQPDGRPASPDVGVGARPLRGRPGVAQDLLDRRRRELRAVGERRHPAVQEVPLAVLDRERAALRLVPGRVQEQRRRERHHGDRDPPPPDALRDQEDQRGNDQEQSDRASQAGGGEQRPGAGCGHHPWPPPPHQQRDRRDDQDLEQRLRHEERLEVDLVAVEQHRCGGHRRQPRADAQVDQDRVDRDAERNAEQVLDRHDQAERVAVRPRPQEEPVQQRPVVAGVEQPGGGQVAVRIPPEQDPRPVGDRGQPPELHREQHHRGDRNRPGPRRAAPSSVGASDAAGASSGVRRSSSTGAGPGASVAGSASILTVGAPRAFMPTSWFVRRTAAARRRTPRRRAARPRPRAVRALRVRPWW
jgi:hypothetical protein